MPQRPHHLRGRQPGLRLPSLCPFPGPSVINTELGLPGLLSVLLHQASNTVQQRRSPLLDHKPSRDAPAKREVSSTPASRGGLSQPDASCSPVFPPLPLALASGQAGKILQRDPSWGCWLSMATVHQGVRVGSEKFCPLLPSPGLLVAILIAFLGSWAADVVALSWEGLSQFFPV